MISRAMISLFLCSLLLVTQAPASAFETDQYNLPPQPLADIGDEVSQHVEQRLLKAVEKINAEIRAHEDCLVKDVRPYGSEFGTDKIAHLFQQGYSYYKICNRALAEGASPDEAAQKAFRWGQHTERTIYGTLVAGVYSNGDLAANFVGMKFYQGLASDIMIGDTKRPAVLLLKDGIWTFNQNIRLRELLLRPFISDHLNEALNPSIFTKYLGVRAYVRRTVRRRSCEKWFDQYPDLSQAGLEETSGALRLWHGEDYGFTDSEHFVTIANTCFADQRAP